MLTIGSLKLKNFISHADTEITFSDGQRCLIDGRSGAGKSAVVESIIWALYGKGRSDNRFLIKNGEKNAEVELLLRNGQAAYRITRKISDAGKQSLSIDIAEDGEEFEPVKAAGLKNIQEWLENNLLKASYTLFINSIAYPQDNTENFVKQTANKRKELLLEIAGAGDYDLLYSRCRDRLSLEEEAVARISSKLEDKKVVAVLADTLPKEIEELSVTQSSSQMELKELDALVEKVSAQLAGANELQKRRELLQDTVAKNKLQSKALLVEIERAQKRIKELEGIDVLFLSMKVEELKAAREQMADYQLMVERELAWSEKFSKLLSQKPRERDFDTEIEKINFSLRDLQNNTDVSCPSIQGMACPKLEAALRQNSAYFEEQLKSLMKGRDEQKASMEAYVKAIDELGKKPETPKTLIEATKALIAELAPYEQKMGEARAAKMTIMSLQEGLKNNQERLELFVAGVMVDEANLAAVEAEIKALNLDKLQWDFIRFKKQQADLKVDLELLLSRISEKRTMLKMAEEAKKSIKDLEEQAKGYVERIESLKALKDAFGSKGIRTVIIDYFVPRLEERINEILSQLSDFRVEINTQRDGADGDSVVEGLFINIIDAQGRCMDFNSYSGGERLKVVVAISEALASLQKIGFRILDELFVGLDQESTDSFAEVLSKIQNRFKQMLCISHLQSIKDVFTDKLEVVKQNGNSLVIA